MKRKLIIGLTIMIAVGVAVGIYKKIRYRFAEYEENQKVWGLVPEMKKFDMTELRGSWPKYQYDVDTVFSEKAQATKYINITASGERVSFENSGSAEVIMVGGSTMFGYGVPDDYTIPSMFNKAQGKYHAVNYGRGGYYSELETKLILKLLRLGKRPAEIIILDGLNDGKKNPLYSNELSFLFDSFNYNKYNYFLAGVGSVMPLIKPRSIGIYENPSYYHDLNLWFDSYLDNISQVAHLQKAYKFKVNVFIQPIPGFDNEFAKHALLINVPSDFHDYQFEKYKVIKKRIGELKKIANVCDLSGLFSGYVPFPFVDGTHYTPTVNAIIAKRMLKFMELGVCDASNTKQEIAPEIAAKLGI